MLIPPLPLPQDKVRAAGDMIKKLRSEKPTLVQSVEKLSEAFIDLAYHDVTAFKKERGPVKLPSSCPLLKLGALREVAVPTVEIDVDPSCCYDNIISIDAFDPCFQLAGGVNLPKVMSCRGSDGKRRRQLVKVACLYLDVHYSGSGLGMGLSVAM